MTLTDPNELKIYTDGGARGNPGPAAIGVVVYHGEQLITTLSEYIGITTNNEAEYKAVIAACKWLEQSEIKPTKIEFFLDSELVVRQLTGVYKISKPHLQALAVQVNQALAAIPAVTFTHVPRVQNKEADALVNQALDQTAQSQNTQ